MNFTLSRDQRIGVVVVFALGGIAMFLLLPPLAQPESYHAFIDDRKMMGIPNCLNVISNVPFAIVGLTGLLFLCRKGRPDARGGFGVRREAFPYAVFFAGSFLTCFGSSYYHWAPEDATLAWDRLPMTLAFMGLLAATVAERIEVRAGLALLGPLIIAGAASVWWWRHSGNLWPFACAQFFSIVLIGMLLALFPPRYTRSFDLLWATGFYALAKISESLDRQVYAVTGFVSGHTVKHLVAALAVYWVLRMLERRSKLGTAATGATSTRTAA
jgi:hypothetical protein